MLSQLLTKLKLKSKLSLQNHDYFELVSEPPDTLNKAAKIFTLPDLITQHCIVPKIIVISETALNKIHENDNRVSLLSYAEYLSEVKR